MVLQGRAGSAEDLVLEQVFEVALTFPVGSLGFSLDRCMPLFFQHTWSFAGLGPFYPGSFSSRYRGWAPLVPCIESLAFKSLKRSALLSSQEA